MQKEISVINPMDYAARFIRFLTTDVFTKKSTDSKQQQLVAAAGDPGNTQDDGRNAYPSSRTSETNSEPELHRSISLPNLTDVIWLKNKNLLATWIAYWISFFGSVS